MTANTQCRENGESKKVIKTWITGRDLSTMIIPKDFAEYYGIPKDRSSYLIVEKKCDCMLIKRLALEV